MRRCQGPVTSFIPSLHPSPSPVRPRDKEHSIDPRTTLGIRNITDYFILFYTKDMVSNRSVLFEAQRNVPYIYGGKIEFLS